MNNLKSFEDYIKENEDASTNEARRDDFVVTIQSSNKKARAGLIIKNLPKDEEDRELLGDDIMTHAIKMLDQLGPVASRLDSIEIKLA